MKDRDLEVDNPLSPKETMELEGSLNSLADGILKRGVKEIKGLALYARIIFSHPMRVLRTVLSTLRRYAPALRARLSAIVHDKKVPIEERTVTIDGPFGDIPKVTDVLRGNDVLGVGR